MLFCISTSTTYTFLQFALFNHCRPVMLLFGVPTGKLDKPEVVERAPWTKQAPTSVSKDDDFYFELKSPSVEEVEQDEEKSKAPEEASKKPSQL